MLELPFLQTVNLGLSYDDHEVLRGVNLRIYEKKITALVGPSGCGKTSLLTCINRLIDMVPKAQVSGEILMGDQSLLSAEIDLTHLRRQIGMIFQKPTPFPFSIKKNLDLPLREHGVKAKSTRDDIIEKVLKDVGLWCEVEGRLESPAMNLSGGQQQRLCIARAIALCPQVILMDEPCSALDPIASAVVEELILKLSEQYTIAIVTHNLSQARRISDNAAMFWLINGVGQLIEFGSTKEIFDNPKSGVTASYVNGLRG